MRRAKPDGRFVAEQAARMSQLLQQRGAIPREELEYVAERVAKMKDDRLQAAVAGLIGWGDEERAEIETFVAIAIEVMKKTNVSKLREAAQVVELRFHLNEITTQSKGRYGD
jgi:multidrug resistance efflux pump